MTAQAAHPIHLIPVPIPVPVRPARTVAQMYGTGETTSPNVHQTIDDDVFTVAVDLTPCADVLLEALAAAIASDEGLAAEWFVLMLNRSTDPARRDLAVRELLAAKPVQRALTIHLTPDAAEELAGMLDDASREPKRCEGADFAGNRWQPAEACERFAEPGESFCARHLDGPDGD